MGQKVHPTGIRLGIVKDWTSKWNADSRTFPEYVRLDYKVREFIKKKLKDASVSQILIERPAKKANITINTARPGIVIGKKGEDIEKLRFEVAKIIEMPIHDVRINIAEVRKPELDAQLVAEGIAQQLERRVMFRRAMKRAVTNTMRVGAEGSETSTISTPASPTGTTRSKPSTATRGNRPLGRYDPASRGALGSLTSTISPRPPLGEMRYAR